MLPIVDDLHDLLRGVVALLQQDPSVVPRHVSALEVVDDPGEKDLELPVVEAAAGNGAVAMLQPGIGYISLQAPCPPELRDLAIRSEKHGLVEVLGHPRCFSGINGL